MPSPIVPPARQNVVAILNRESGTLVKLGPDLVARDLRTILEELGCTVELHEISAKEISAALTAARDGSADLVIVGGGDGTVAAAASLFCGHEKPLGILPLGTFNLAARDVGMPLDWRVAARSLVTAPIAAMDLLDVGGRRYLCMVVLGFYPSLLMGQSEYHGSWLVKTLHTFWATLRSAASFPPLHLRLNDGRTVHQHRTRIALMANNDYQDIFGVIPFRESLDAGYFTVYISKHQSSLGLLRSCLAWILGRWKEDREITKLRATELEIDVARKRSLAVLLDGEVEKIKTPFTIRLLPRALRVVAPRLLTSPELQP